jgi:hypothetical protein
LLVLELDEVGNYYEGLVFAYNAAHDMPAMIGEIRIQKDHANQKVRIPIFPVERGSGAIYTAENLAKRFPTITVPTHANAELKIGLQEIHLSWVTNIGTSGTAQITRSEGGNDSTITPIASVSSWEDFKRYASQIDPYRFLFRGQENNRWKLRTSFHRTGRASIIKFATQDVTALHRSLSGLTAHRFNLADPLDYAAFLNFVQHHGYPTPLLDWTQSPFIAAYFAYRNLLHGRYATEQRIRIHVFDGRAWSSDYERGPVLSPAFLHITVLEPLAINNPRVVPQQSISTVTNVDDMESYIHEREIHIGKSYLTAIDLPACDRNAVVRELDLMGINAGSLFPGLDGACGQLRDRFFDL